MPYIGNKTADTTLVEDNSISSAKIVDDAVIESKLNLISTSSVPSLEAKGTSGVTEGYIQLNCAENSHGIKLKSPPHSAGASYTLTFPNNDGNANQVLTTDGSGVLSFADAPSGAVTLLNSSAATTGDSELLLTSVFSSTYEVYIVDVIGYQPSTAGYLLARTGNSGGYTGSSAYYFSGFGKNDDNTNVDNYGTTQNKIYLHPTSTRSDDHLNLKMNVYIPTGVGSNKPHLFYTGAYVQDSGSKSTSFFGQATLDSTAALTSIKFFPSAGTINDLQVKVYGFQKAI